MMEKNAKIYVAGHRGLVGSAIWENLERKGYENLVGRTHKELDLLDGIAVKRFFDEEQPEYVILAAAHVGGIMANSGDAPLHRQVADVEVQRFSREPVHHLDAEGRERIAVVGFLREEAHRLLDEGVETLFRREVRRVAGHRRPVECRAVDGVVARYTLHARQLAAHIVLDMLQFLRVIAPRHDVKVRPYRGQPVGMGFVQVLVYPLAVDAVAPAVSGERLHIPRRLLEFLKVFFTVVDNHILVVDVVAREQQPHGRGKGEAAVASIR